MERRAKWNYLSQRVCILAIGGGGTVFLLLLFCLRSALLGRSVFWPLLFAIVVAALLCPVVWFCVVEPYRRLERLTQLFLDGYETEVSYFTLLSLSPASRQTLQRLMDALSPSQLFALNKRQAQYMALQNQINPHFLYNTLESIRSEALVSELYSIADMTEALASFFRYTISKNESLVSVEEELENCETYFRIQRYRFGDRLHLKIECDPLDKEEIYQCRLPKLTLQPILENCIVHGTELKIEPGNLTITLMLTVKRLMIRISDDGVGMDETTLARLNGRLSKQERSSPSSSGDGGVALINVSNRIRLLFGDEYGIHVFSLPGIGTDVELTLPAITNDRDVQNREVLQ